MRAGFFSQTMMLARNTSAATILEVEFGFPEDFIVSLTLLTLERDIMRIGPSLDRRIGRCEPDATGSGMNRGSRPLYLAYV